MQTSSDGGTGPDRAAELAGSAKGWHGVQLAVLGFIGLCGILKGGSGSAGTGWLPVVVGSLVLLALVLQCVAVASVASVAWPLHGETVDAERLQSGRRTLRRGVLTTFVAVAVLALATTSAWWPSQEAGEAQVRVRTPGGEVCGEVRDSDPGVLAVEAGGRTTLVALRGVTQIEVVASC